MLYWRNSGLQSLVQAPCYYFLANMVQKQSCHAITQRLLGVIGMALALALGPLWPAFGEAKARGDIDWILLTFNGQ